MAKFQQFGCAAVKAGSRPAAAFAPAQFGLVDGKARRARSGEPRPGRGLQGGQVRGRPGWAKIFRAGERAVAVRHARTELPLCWR
jgi:hypothetical protein